MSKLLDKIAGKFDGDRVRRLEVPDWGEPAVRDAAGEVTTPAKPLVMTYSPVTLNDLATIADLDGDNFFHRAARLVCLKARDEQGKPLFSLIDALQLRANADPTVIIGLYTSMVGDRTVDISRKN